ncbi:MAG: tripartite tricarboxylate transporter TctB family protein [Alphaproteobacteria bacterium]|nr:tripartite tricarboxylate transporter TctB family protein [Alphaproteobacteria bacterium]
MSIVNKFTVRRAEITVAVVLALCSIALMTKSAQNRITWSAEENMGAGFLPFYLSLGMLICTVLTIVKFILKKSPQSKDTSAFIDPEAFKFVSVTLISLIVLVFTIGYLGIYFSLIFFLAFYLRYFSEKSISFITIFSLTTPILTFLFFEWLLKIPLPQGISEPLFYPVYDFMYGKITMPIKMMFIVLTIFLPTALVLFINRFIK